MSDNSKIEWTEATWNPIRARNRETGGLGHFCVHVSEGCRNCYAERLQPRFGNPVRYAAQDRTKVELFLDEEVLAQPLRWRRPRRVFVCSMTDLFFEDHPDEWLDRVFAVMRVTPHHTYQLLTKRPARMRRWFESSGQAVPAADAERRDDVAAWAYEMFSGLASRSRRGELEFYEEQLFVQPEHGPLPNVWLGVSAEDQVRAEERIPELLATPAAVRWLSAEPLLLPIDVTRWLMGEETPGLVGNCIAWRPPLDWVVAGGESGPGARPMHPDWARSLREQCVAAEVPFFFKQWGEFVPQSQAHEDLHLGDYRSLLLPTGRERGRDHVIVDEDNSVFRVGKQAAGRLLDGRPHDDYPEVRR